jgi:hypothetical protein
VQQIFGAYTLDDTKTPKEITFSARVGIRGRVAQLEGVYQLEGDRLTIAYHEDGPRPKNFESKPGSGVTLLRLKRQDASKPTPDPEPAKPLDEAKPTEKPASSSPPLPSPVR